MMKKCHKCEIVYHSTYRTHCLYCDSALLDADFDEVFREGAQAPTSKTREFAKAVGVTDQDHLHYIVSSYFRSRSLSFLYRLSRNEFKMGEKFKRILIQSIDISCFAKIPWTIINIIDSLVLRLMLNQYCPQCGWKYSAPAKTPHDSVECEYNKEYALVLNEILKGSILQNEEQIERQALEKTKQGKKSAYFELSARKTAAETYFDVFIILLSLGIFIYCFVSLVMPIFGQIYDF